MSPRSFHLSFEALNIVIRLLILIQITARYVYLQFLDRIYLPSGSCMYNMMETSPQSQLSCKFKPKGTVAQRALASRQGRRRRLNAQRERSRQASEPIPRSWGVGTSQIGKQSNYSNGGCSNAFRSYPCYISNARR